MRPIDKLERTLDALGVTYKRTTFTPSGVTYYFFEYNVPSDAAYGTGALARHALEENFPDGVGINDISGKMPNLANQLYMSYWHLLPDSKRFENCYYLYPLILNYKIKVTPII